MLKLVLLRHAKAEPHGSTDAQRELSARGRDQAAGVGEDLRERGLLPDLVLCSAAVRTRQTWAQVLAQFGEHRPEVRFLEELYGAGPSTVRELLTSGGPASGTVLVVGHEPIMSMTAAQYGGPESDVTALMGVRTGMPTASYAIIDLDGPGEASGTLRELVRSSR